MTFLSKKVKGAPPSKGLGRNRELDRRLSSLNFKLSPLFTPGFFSLTIDLRGVSSYEQALKDVAKDSRYAAGLNVVFVTHLTKTTCILGGTKQNFIQGGSARDSSHF